MQKSNAHDDGQDAGLSSEQTGSLQSKVKRTWRAPQLQSLGKVAAQTMSTGSGANDMTTMLMSMSDREAKQDVVRIGTHPLGIGLYLFRYKPCFAAVHGAGRRFGVMAQEVQRVLPTAVIIGDDGYKRVDYRQLGIVAY